MDTPKYKAIIFENNLKLAEKIFHNYRYKEGATTRQVGGGEIQSNWDP